MGNPSDRIPFGQETITVSSSEVLLDNTIYNPYADGHKLETEIYVETAQIRFGFYPNGATTGPPVEAGQNFSLYNETEIKNVRLIRGGSTDATVRVQYFKTPLL